MRKVRIGIADDSPTDVKIISWYLRREKSNEIIFVATNGKDLLFKMRDHPVDVAIVDLYMPGMCGMEAIEELVRSPMRRTRILATSGGFYRNVINQLQALQVEGFCRKEGEMLLKAVEKIVDGKTFFDYAYDEIWKGREHLAPPDRFVPENKAHKISALELEIINALASGHSVEAIQQQFGYSYRTIEAYIANMIGRFKLNNRVHLIAYAYANGLLQNFDEFENLPRLVPSELSPVKP